MSSTMRPPAIAGVSSGNASALVAFIYPSIAAQWPGRAIGQLMESIPVKIGGIKLSYLLFGLPAALAAVPGFFLLKLTGEFYAVTNRSVQLRSSMGNRLRREVPLSEIDEVVVHQLPGQEFYPAGDIELLSKAGDTLLTLPGVPRAEVFRQTILEARDARRQIEASLSTIKARQAG